MRYLQARSLILIFPLLLGTQGCSGDPVITGEDPVIETPPPPPPPPPPAPPTPSVTAVEEFTTLDLANLDSYITALPAYYQNGGVAAQDNSGGNPVTNAGATLGRVLFFDQQLSINNTVSCATCHLRDEGFTDPDQFSTGFDGASLTGAHSMRLGNARWYNGSGFFWDKRAATLEEQATQPIQNDVEMGFDEAHGGIDSLISKMEGLAYYPELFAFVFGDSTITENRIQRAIAQYVRSMAAVDSKWDDGYSQTFNPGLPDNGLSLPLPNFTAEENRGRELFILPRQDGGAGCAGCHRPPTFSLAADALSNGLDAGETTIFKSPSLKNVAIDGPYMHDGRFDTLEDVIGFYNNGIQNGPALDQRLRSPGGQPIRLNLSQADRSALVAFLETLTDPGLQADARYTTPLR